MKTVILAYTVVILIISLVILNSIFVSYNIKEIIRQIGAFDDGEKTNTNDTLSEYEKIYLDYKRREKFISLTVSHEDLTDISTEFQEIIGAARANDTESIIIAKSRLIGSLEHTRRLCGINLDSIF